MLVLTISYAESIGFRYFTRMKSGLEDSSARPLELPRVIIDPLLQGLGTPGRQNAPVEAPGHFVFLCPVPARKINLSRLFGFFQQSKSPDKFTFAAYTQQFSLF